jgi:hypothetical protein
MSVFVLIHFGFHNKLRGIHTTKLICSTPKLQSSYKLWLTGYTAKPYVNTAV